MFDNIYHIPTGTLTLQTNGDPNSLLDVQARNNPKRGFLFVSKVLGKHLAVTLEQMRASYRSLVDRLPKMMGETLVIGMAETATQLGYGVWNELAQREHDTVWFLHTTRYRTSDDALGFEESHSHAPSQWIQGLSNECLNNVKNVVLVDDELSTGKTFHALQAVISRALPSVRQVHWVCLTDFRPLEHQNYPAVSLLQGSWAFEWSNVPQNVKAAEGQPVDPLCIPFDFGRKQPMNLARRDARIVQNMDNLNDELAWRGIGKNVLVLGSGEFMPYAFEMGQVLEQQGMTVHFQATTRSPALMPRVELGADHYGEGVEQYIYNFNREAFDSVVVFVESDVDERLISLAQRLKAHVVNVQNWV